MTTAVYIVVAMSSCVLFLVRLSALDIRTDLASIGNPREDELFVNLCISV